MSGKSKYKETVYENLLSRYDHPTAEEIYFSLKKVIPNLSLATVYRNLKALEIDGLIMKISTENCDRFDGHTKKHHHLICDECNRVFDVELEREYSPIPLAKFDGDVTNYCLMFRGLCKGCKSEKNKI